MAVNIPSQIVVQTAAQWAVDVTIYSEKRLLVTSDQFYTGTDFRRFKIADGVQTWAQLQELPINSLIALGTSLQAQINNMDIEAVRSVGNVLGGNIDANGNTIENLGTPVNPGDAVPKSWAEQLVVGLLDDRGNFDASVNLFPSSGGSGTAGAVLKGDLWTVSVSGTLGGIPVTAGDLVRALVDTPGQTSSNWAVTENNIGYVAENQANKENTTLDTSTTKYPTNRLTKEYADTKLPISAVRRVTVKFQHTAFNPSNGVTYNFGPFGAIVPVTGASTRFTIPATATGVLNWIRVTGNWTTGTSQGVTLQIVNLTQATTATLTSSFNMSTLASVPVDFTGIGLAVTEGDQLQFRIICPTWGTPPTAVTLTGNGYINVT